MKKETTLEKKLRKFFRKKQWENFWLGFKGNKYQLATIFPLDSYQKLALTADEFYEFVESFEEFEEKYAFFSSIPTIMWFNRCLADERLFDKLSDEQLEKIVNDNCWGILDFFRNQWLDRRNRQHRIIRLLHQDRLELWISRLSSNDISTFNSFLLWEDGRDGEYVAEQEKSTRIFEKLARLSDAVVAKLLEATESCVSKRILKQARKLERNQIEIYKNIHSGNLYDVLKKTDFDLLDNADSDVYTWVYDHIAEMDKKDFCCYLADEKCSEMELFDAKICVGIYNVLDWEQNRIFVKEVFTKNGCEAFEKFYEEIPKRIKEELFELLLKDEEGRKIVDFLLATKPEEDLSLLERLIKEKYVTQE